MDATQAVLTVLHERLALDPDLQTTLGPHYEGPYHKAPRDAAWPYLTHKLDTLDGVDRATRPATYQLHVWDRSTTTDLLWSARARVMALLDGARLTVPEQGAVRLWHASDAWMPDEDTDVTHLVLSFMVRYARAAEVRAILTEKGT